MTIDSLLHKVLVHATDSFRIWAETQRANEIRLGWKAEVNWLLLSPEQKKEFTELYRKEVDDLIKKKRDQRYNPQPVAKEGPDEPEGWALESKLFK